MKGRIFSTLLNISINITKTIFSMATAKCDTVACKVSFKTQPYK